MINIKEQLKQLRTIEPDRDFAIRAKYAIIGNRDIRESSFSLPRFSFSRNAWALSGAGLTAILILVVVAVPLVFPKPTLSASLSPETLIGEYGNLPINIQLKEITYEQTVSQTISSAINEVSDTKTSHLNSDLINSEAQKNASIDDTGAKNVDTLLNQVIN